MWQPDGGLRLTWPGTPRTTKYDVRLTGSTGRELLKIVTRPVLVLWPSEVATLNVIEVVVEAAAASGEHASRTGSAASACGSARPAKSRNPKTGDKVDVPPKKVPCFKPGKKLKELINREADSGEPPVTPPMGSPGSDTVGL